MERLRQMMRTTAFRLTLLYTVLFGVLAIGVVVYISSATGRILISQMREAVDEEVASIARFTRRGGVRRLVPMIERRSRQPGANLYLVTDLTGRIIAGNVRKVPARILSRDGWRLPPFAYTGFEDDGPGRRAIARVFTLPNGLKLMVGRDIGEAVRFRSIVLRASSLSLIVMVLTGVLLWYLVARRALRHIDRVSLSSQRIIAGDLSERLPLSGRGDEFDRLSTILNTIIERVEKLNSGMISMSDSIAHDLRTPLTRLRNRADEALVNPETNPDALHQIIADADGLIRTFDALLMISQVGSGARAVELVEVDVPALVHDVHELFEPVAEESGVSLKLEADAPILVRGNRELLAQLLTNLLDNALKYGVDGDNPTIILSADARKRQAVLTVADNGSGIRMEDRGRVLDRFVRLDQSRQRPGSGLGLALVEAVTDLHGGTLSLEDNEPGLRVVVSLPLIF